MKQFDMTDFYKGLKRLREFPVGKTFYTIKDNKIKPVLIRKGTFIYTDPSPKDKDETTLAVVVQIEGIIDNSSYGLDLRDIYETKELAAEAFLEQNNIPKKLLQVLYPPKAKTTIGDLIEKLQIVDPEIDLGKDFWKVLKPITKAIESPETTPEYWDCECEEEYVHPVAQPCCTKCGSVKGDCSESRVVDVTPENMHRG